MKSWVKWLIAAVVVIVVAVIAVPFVYINFIKEDAPAELAQGCAPAADSTGSTTPTSTGGSAFTASGGTAIEPERAAGDWTVGPSSVVGYRVTEVLFGQDVVAVGRTGDVTGQLSVEGDQMTSATFEVNMATITSPEDRRDNQFRGRIMDTATFPTATFTLTEPAALPTAATQNATTATGDLTLRGVTKPVTLAITAVDCGDYMSVLATTQITFTDFEIPDPQAPGITTQDNGTLEALLRFVAA